MRVSYKKLWIKLAELEMSKAQLRTSLKFAPGTLTKLNKNEPVSLDILMRICELLACDVGDVCEFIPDSPEKMEGQS